MNSVLTHVHVDNVTLRLSLHHTGLSDMIILLCNNILLLQEKWPFSNEIDMHVCPENELGSKFHCHCITLAAHRWGQEACLSF